MRINKRQNINRLLQKYRVASVKFAENAGRSLQTLAS
jgi:hypothetical protein